MGPTQSVTANADQPSTEITTAPPTVPPTPREEVAPEPEAPRLPGISGRGRRRPAPEPPPPDTVPGEPPE